MTEINDYTNLYPSRTTTDGIDDNNLTAAYMLGTADANAEIARLNAVVDAVRVQAQVWASEADAQRDTVHRIYEIVTGKKGEPGDWNGEVPVRAEITRLNAVIRAMARKIHEQNNMYVGFETVSQVIDHFHKEEAHDVQRPPE